MKEPNANGVGKSLAFNGWGFLILLFTVGDSQILILYTVGMRVQCSFPMGMKFQGIFLTDFSSGEGVPPGL